MPVKSAANIELKPLTLLFVLFFPAISLQCFSVIIQGTWVIAHLHERIPPQFLAKPRVVFQPYGMAPVQDCAPIVLQNRLQHSPSVVRLAALWIQPNSRIQVSYRLPKLLSFLPRGSPETESDGIALVQFNGFGAIGNGTLKMADFHPGRRPAEVGRSFLPRKQDDPAPLTIGAIMISG